MLRFTNVDHKPVRHPPVYGYRTHPLLPLRQALDPILSRINGLDDYIKIAKTECHYPSEHGLTREESASIYLYTMDWGEQSLYRVLNGALRVKDRSVLMPWHGYLKLFDTALKKLPSLQMNLWRGISVDISKNYKEGEEVTWWYFSSCSSQIKVVKKFLGPVSTLFMIEAKNGKRISEYSSFPEEKEVILGLGTRVRVVDNALDHSTLNLVHLVELLDENDLELPSSRANMNVIQPVKTLANTSTNNKPSTFEVRPYSNGSRNEGEWNTERKHGNGSYSYTGENKNTGYSIDDHRTDQVVFTWFDGSRYEGQYKDGKKNGKGAYIFAGGNRYTGDWIDDRRTGQGVFTWFDGSRYQGQFKDDKANGKGTMYFTNGSKYTGDWVHDRRTGQGVFTWYDGRRYEGQFKDDKANGKGTMYFTNESNYIGDWVHDRKTGQGVFTWFGGNRYEGQFKDDKMHGKGKMRFANGQVQEGMWANDYFIG